MRTNVQVTNDTLYLFRLIDNKFYRIAFTKDVRVCDVADYFNINDTKFKLLSRT
jgi:hypothetical protein